MDCSTLSLIVHLCLPFVPKLKNTKMLVNYGFDKVRFSAPVKVGSRIRARGKLADIAERRPGHVIVRLDVTIEIENEDKARARRGMVEPACRGVSTWRREIGVARDRGACERGRSH